MHPRRVVAGSSRGLCSLTMVETRKADSPPNAAHALPGDYQKPASGAAGAVVGASKVQDFPSSVYGDSQSHALSSFEPVWHTPFEKDGKHGQADLSGSTN